MRALFLVPLLLPLGLALLGCESVSRTGADGFEVGPGGAEAYELDAQACQTRSNDVLSYDVRLMDASRYARNRAFNSLYAACMTKRGYRPRAYLENVLPDIAGP
jgi:hypothetical protein